MARSYDDFRAGPFTQEEVEYIEQVAEDFRKGLLDDIENGTHLRQYLSTLLHCRPMRLSKRFGQPTKVLGLCIYDGKRYDGVTDKEARREKRERLRQAFLDSVETQTKYFVPIKHKRKRSLMKKCRKKQRKKMYESNTSDSEPEYQRRVPLTRATSSTSGKIQEVKTLVEAASVQDQSIKKERGLRRCRRVNDPHRDTSDEEYIEPDKSYVEYRWEFSLRERKPVKRYSPEWPQPSSRKKASSKKSLDPPTAIKQSSPPPSLMTYDDVKQALKPSVSNPISSTPSKTSSIDYIFAEFPHEASDDFVSLETIDMDAFDTIEIDHPKCADLFHKATMDFNKVNINIDNCMDMDLLHDFITDVDFIDLDHPTWPMD